MSTGPTNRASSADGEFAGELRQLKREGASVLVVGTIQPEQREDVCTRLFGHASDEQRRRIAVSATDRSAWQPSNDDEPTPATFRHITYDAPARGATTSHTGPTDTGREPTTATTHSPSVVSSHSEARTLAELGIAISSAIEYFDTDANGLEPAELRLGIDSVLPLLEAYDRENVFTFLHLVNGRVTDVDGMIQCHLPVERDATVVSVLSPLFDVVLEVRERADGYEERWSLKDGDLESSWISRS